MAVAGNVGLGARTRDPADVVIEVGERTLDARVAHERLSVAIRTTHSRIISAIVAVPDPTLATIVLPSIRVRCHASKVSGVVVDRSASSTRRPSVWAAAR